MSGRNLQIVAVYGNVMNRQNVTKKETSRWEKFRRRWWGARRSHDMVQRAGGRLLWLGDTEAGSRLNKFLDNAGDYVEK